jgi:hypothetical protein
MVPYAVAVNVGSYADAARGTIEPGKSITNAIWKSGSKSITGITKANPAVVTSNNHGFSNGDRVYISGVSGMTQVNGKVYTVAGATTNTFQLSGVKSSSYSTYKKNGTIEKCITPDCEVQVTSAGHGFVNNDHIVISGVKGMTQINSATNATWQVSDATTDTFVLSGSYGPNYSTYTDSGNAYCTVAGCQYFRFHNASSSAQRVYQVRQCTTERTGDEAFTDASPTDFPVGRHYSKNASECPSNELVPLTSDKTLLSNRITALTTAGATAGHLGAAWGLYTLSPTFGAIFPEESRPAEFGRPKLHKFAVFMTDGEFNSAFCQNVLAKGSNGSSSDQINCTPENGNSFAQAQEYCTAMKNEGVVVYTVGLEVTTTSLKDALKSCATSSQYAYFPASASELIVVFQQIGRAINEVRLVH